MKYNGREIEKGEKIVVFGEDEKEAVATYVRDEKIEVLNPIFEYKGEEIRGVECWWMPSKEAEEVRKEVDYNKRSAKFAEIRGTSKHD